MPLKNVAQGPVAGKRVSDFGWLVPEWDWERNIGEPKQVPAGTHPDVVDEWHPTKNGNLTPDQVTYGSRRDVWWQCPTFETHAYRTRIRSGTSMLVNCTVCARRPSRRELGATRDAGDSTSAKQSGAFGQDEATYPLDSAPSAAIVASS
jgi:hypothetical protein